MSFIPMGSALRFDTGSIPPVHHPLGSSEISQSTPTVFIVDGDKDVCESLALLNAGEGWRLETFKSAEEFLRRPKELLSSCLMLEASLPGISGLELQKRVAAERPDIPVIFICTEGDVFTAVEAMKAGAAEFFTKPFRGEELLSAIREGLRRSRLALARGAEKQAIQGRYAALTRREQQVMALVASGLLNKQVGGILSISETTVKAHRGQVMLKMQANSLPDLVRMASKLCLAKGLASPAYRQNTDRVVNLAGPLFGTYSMVPNKQSAFAG